MIIESKATRLAEHIQFTIEEDELEAGTPLGTKAELLIQYKVASGTLNEALRLLQSRGFVSVKPGPRGGAFVAENVGRVAMSHTLLAAQDDPRGLDQCFQIQDALQEDIVITAAAACDAEDRERIGRAVRSMADARDSAEMLTAIWDTDQEIAVTSPNKMMADIYCLVLDNIRSLVKRWPPRNSATEHMVRIHHDLALAVMANDIAGAQRLAREHSPIDYAQEARELLLARRKSGRSHAAAS